MPAWLDGCKHPSEKGTARKPGNRLVSCHIAISNAETDSFDIGLLCVSLELEEHHMGQVHLVQWRIEFENALTVKDSTEEEY